MATSWHINKKSRLIVEHRPNQIIESVLLMNFCPGSREPSPLSVQISGESVNGKPWRVEAELLEKSRYYHKVVVGKRSLKRVILSRIKAKNGEPVCIAELRVQYR